MFEQWMQQFDSPVIGLRLGSENVVVAMTYPMVRAVHTDPDYDGRPDNFFLRLRTMGTRYAIGKNVSRCEHQFISNLRRLGITFTDGDLWLEQRNFATRHLRNAGYGRKPMELQIHNELNELLQVIASCNDTAVWPGTFLSPSVLNVLWTFTAGATIGRDDARLGRLLELMQQRSKAFDMSGGVLNQMAWLRHLAPEWTGFNLINRFNAELRAFFTETIEAHKLDYTDERSGDDLIYAYLREMRANADNPLSTFSELQLIMVILDMFIAGSQTTSITIDLALMTLATRPELQQRMHTELNALGGQTPAATDRARLPFTEAVLMEVQRFYHIVPVSGPRRTMHETQLGGYTIPRNTTILMGLRTVHMDRVHWGDPQQFRPERFLSDAGDELVNTEWLMPFGQGRRRCLGESLARACLFTFFAGIMNRFEVHLQPGDLVPERKLLPGIVLSPKPYRVVFKDRFVKVKEC